MSSAKSNTSWWEKWLFIILAIGFPSLMIHLKANGLGTDLLLGYLLIGLITLAGVGLTMFLVAMLIR